MKAVIQTLLISIIALLSVQSSVVAQSNWVLKSTGTNFNDVESIDMLTAFVVGDSGTILATVDGGANWICLPSNTSQRLKSIFFISDLTGWIAGDEGIILKTSDGGESWTSLSSGTTSHLSAVFFSSPDTGYITGPLVTLKTTNGGTSWISLISVSANALYFSSNTMGIATKASGTLSRTTNGGSAWFTDVMTYPSSRYAVSFVNAATGWVSGFGISVNKTTNGGNNWSSYSTGLSGFPYLYGIDFTDVSTGYCVGSGGTAIKTTNGGSNWMPLSPGTSNTLNALSFANDLYGWAVGEKGTIIHTSDGGATWNHQTAQYSAPFSQTYSINDVEFRNESTGWSVGFLGVVNKTTNGGNTWTSLSSATFNWLYSIDFLNGNDTGFACGRLGTIERTINGGLNWSLQSSVTSQHLNSISVNKFTGDTIETIWCAGNAGTMIISVNGGSTWELLTPITTNDLNSVSVLDEFNIVAARKAGTLLKTYDGGANWTSMTSGTSEEIKSMHFINSSTGYICGSGGMIRKTSDGGSSWLPQTSPVTSSLNSLMFEDVDTENGYAVGDNGVILTTTDFGTTWLKETSGASSTLNAVFAKSNHLSPEGSIVVAAGTLGKIVRKIVPVALPVELTSFSAIVTGNNVALHWETYGETNNYGFEIQRNRDDNWNICGFVPGRVFSNVYVQYAYSDKFLMPGKYNYRLKQFDANGNFRYYSLEEEITISTPTGFVLEQNYPNPFNPATRINFSLPVRERVSLKIYDLTGRIVKSLIDEVVSEGEHSVEFTANDFASGVYIYVISAGSFKASKKMTLIK
jgi:photosystem II stability/assembly factor-like uncharacterized protein